MSLILIGAINRFFLAAFFSSGLTSSTSGSSATSSISAETSGVAGFDSLFPLVSPVMSFSVARKQKLYGFHYV